MSWKSKPLPYVWGPKPGCCWACYHPLYSEYPLKVLHKFVVILRWELIHRFSIAMCWKVSFAYSDSGYGWPQLLEQSFDVSRLILKAYSYDRRWWNITIFDPFASGSRSHAHTHKFRSVWDTTACSQLSAQCALFGWMFIICCLFLTELHVATKKNEYTMWTGRRTTHPKESKLLSLE